MGAAVFGIYALIFGALSIRHVSYALVALICMFAYEQWGAIYLSFVASNGTLVNIAALTLVAIAWFRLPAGSSFEIVQYPTRALLTLFLLYTFTTTLWSPPDAEATKRFLDESHYLITATILAPLLIRTSADFSRVLDAVTWVGGLASYTVRLRARFRRQITHGPIRSRGHARVATGAGRFCWNCVPYNSTASTRIATQSLLGGSGLRLGSLSDYPNRQSRTTTIRHWLTYHLFAASLERFFVEPIHYPRTGCACGRGRIGSSSSIRKTLSVAVSLRARTALAPLRAWTALVSRSELSL